MQYFTGASGSFQSYNYQGGTLLQSQNYAVCIRQEECGLGSGPVRPKRADKPFSEGFCEVSYSQSSSSMSNTFSLYGSAEDVVGNSSQNVCPQTYVLVPNAAADVLGGTLCGGLLNPVAGMTNTGSVEGACVGGGPTYATALVLLTGPGLISFPRSVGPLRGPHLLRLHPGERQRAGRLQPGLHSAGLHLTSKRVGGGKGGEEGIHCRKDGKEGRMKGGSRNRSLTFT